MGAVTPGETLGTLYNIHVGSNKTKQHSIETVETPERAAEREQGRAPSTEPEPGQGRDRLCVPTLIDSSK